jgi:ABC-type lipoprotein release transport system permease subunit
MKILNRLNSLSLKLLTLAGVLAVASAAVNVFSALTMFVVERIDRKEA